MKKPPAWDPFGDDAPNVPPQEPLKFTAELFIKVLREYETSSVPSVAEVPQITLENWQVYRVCNEDHFIGWSQQFCDGCISGTLVEISIDARIGRTEGGRIFILDGYPGRSPEAQRLLNWSLHKWGFKWEGGEVVEVTADYDAQHRCYRQISSSGS